MVARRPVWAFFRDPTGREWIAQERKREEQSIYGSGIRHPNASNNVWVPPSSLLAVRVVCGVSCGAAGGLWLTRRKKKKVLVRKRINGTTQLRHEFMTPRFQPVSSGCCKVVI
jgi:hypothetical protein